MIQILDLLKQCKTREDGYSVLVKLSGKQLTELSNLIFVSGKNKTELRTRIVERVIGLRLRQDVILNLL